MKTNFYAFNFHFSAIQFFSYFQLFSYFNLFFFLHLNLWQQAYLNWLHQVAHDAVKKMKTIALDWQKFPSHISTNAKHILLVLWLTQSSCLKQGQKDKHSVASWRTVLIIANINLKQIFHLFSFCYTKIRWYLLTVEMVLDATFYLLIIKDQYIKIFGFLYL